MSTKIVFYILKKESSLKACALYTCRIIEKAYSNNHKIYIYANDLNDVQNFDKQLWTFRDISFVPHEIYNQDTNSEAQILIGSEQPPASHNDILVNITTETIPFHQQFSRIIEVVPNDDSLKALARNRFNTYKKENLQIETFNV